jgi:hypothetical protein
MCLRRVPEKYITGAALDRAEIDHKIIVDPIIFFNSVSTDSKDILVLNRSEIECRLFFFYK